jgi:hypothetical protein
MTVFDCDPRLLRLSVWSKRLVEVLKHATRMGQQPSASPAFRRISVALLDRTVVHGSGCKPDALTS